MLQRSGVIYIYKAPMPYIPPIIEEPIVPPPAPPVQKPVVATIQSFQPVQPISHQPAQQKKPRNRFRRVFGSMMLIAAIAGMTFPFLPQARLESAFFAQQMERRVDMMVKPTIAMPPSVPLSYSPLIGPDGKEITPINKEFSVIVPKIGINANIVASVNPLNQNEYTEALSRGVAHAKTSYFPNQDGSVYLFSHSTNYQWFVKDLNAIFYNVKNLEDGDDIIVYYQGVRYTYKYKSREVVKAKDTTYLLPVTGKRQLILQTCWPPGTTTSRLFIFADLVEIDGKTL